MAVGFATFLEAAGIPVDRTRLVRHQGRSVTGKAPYDLWQARNGDLETYQSLQGRPVYADATYIASFVATPLNETLFVGIYRILGNDYQVAILEVTSSSMQKSDIERLEALWKTKLMTRKFGLNRN